MVDIMHRLIAADERYNLRIIGPLEQGDCLAAFRDQARRLGVADQVHYDGCLPHDEVAAWLAERDYLLSTSLHEGHPVGLNEAMACGIRPVIYAYPGAEEVFPPDLLFMRPEEAVAQIRAPDYNSRSYHEWVAQRFPLDEQIRQLEGVLTPLFAARRPGRPLRLPLTLLSIGLYRVRNRLRGLLTN
jgi:glycosyltransferase involved in cell wall biosynthesis